jgi:entry exclusion lipoprotein TrbK
MCAVIALCLSLVLLGCERQPVDCSRINEVKDVAARKELAKRCPIEGQFKPSPPKTW